MKPSNKIKKSKPFLKSDSKLIINQKQNSKKKPFTISKKNSNNIPVLAKFKQQKSWKSNLNFPFKYTRSTSLKATKKAFFKLKKRTFFKLKKKWRFWRIFKRYFLYKKKITFLKKIKWSFNNIRIIKQQLSKLYLIKKKTSLIKYSYKQSHNKFFFFLRLLELRLGIILLRSRFFYKLINSYNAIKMNLILVNGYIINKINHLMKILDLFQKRRSKNIKIRRKKYKRILRFKWRKHRWKQARYIIWKIRRMSHFNMYWIKKQNTILNYMEINYKIPAGIIIKQPFLKELFLNKHKSIVNTHILKKLYFLY